MHQKIKARPDDLRSIRPLRWRLRRIFRHAGEPTDEIEFLGAITGNQQTVVRNWFDSIGLWESR